MSQSAPRRLGASQVLQSLRTEIVDGSLQYGDQLPPERTLAERFGVARGTVREALTQLAASEHVEIRRGSGSYVIYRQGNQSNPAIENARPLELIDARFALEPHICRLAVLHAGHDDIEQAEAQLRIMEDSVEDPQRFSEADMRFHTLLARSAGNGLLAWVVTEISSVRDQKQWARMLRLTLTPETILTYNAQHRRILDAIADREPETAADEMKQHLETARLSLTRAAAT